MNFSYLDTDFAQLADEIIKVPKGSISSLSLTRKKLLPASFLKKTIHSWVLAGLAIKWVSN